MFLTIFKAILLIFLLITAVAVFFIKSPLTSIVVFMSYSSVMAIIWILLEAPDLAITEAAVGAGITSVLFFLALQKIRQIDANLNSFKKKNKSSKEKNENEKSNV